MKKEIGGFFGLDSFDCDAEYYDALSLNSGRNAFAYLIQSRGITKIYLPHFICDSIKNICAINNVQIIFYSLTENLEPNFAEISDNKTFLYLVNYYGLISNNRIREISKRYKRLIVDNVQAFFQKPVNNIDSIYSCRKFFGVPDGSYLFTSCFLDKDFPKDDSTSRLTHLIGRNTSSAKEYYQEYLENEKRIDSLTIMRMSLTTHSLLKKIDYLKCKKQRTINFKYLHKKLANLNLLQINENIRGAFAYPLLIKNGEGLRSFLISNNVYVPILWPGANDNQANYLSTNILPLPCDHRYKTDDMKLIVKYILEYEN